MECNINKTMMIGVIINMVMTTEFLLISKELFQAMNINNNTQLA